MKLRIFSFLLVIISGTVSCNSNATGTQNAGSNSKEVEKVARDFFATFAARDDWEKMLSFYRYDMQFEDVALQVKVFNKEDFKDFYNWTDPNFRKLSPEQQHLELADLVVSGNIAVGRGHFNPFLWQDQLQAWKWGSEFTIWLYFDEQLKIKRQIDFIEYPDDILEDVIRGYREARGD